MDYLLLNRTFAPTPDGWSLLVPYAEVPQEDGLVQVTDAAACAAMLNDFRQAKQDLLIDFDHLSFDPDQASVAAGWIDDVEHRADGLYCHVRWSDLGDAAVKGGRYRYLSAVFPRATCDELGGGRVRPRQLLCAGLTNQPRFGRRLKPLANRDNPNQEVRMSAIAKALGLAETADEAACLAAIQTLKTERDQEKTQVAELKNRNTALEKEANERAANEALTEYADVIQDQAAVKAQLLANRDGAIAVLKGLRKPGAEGAAVLPNRATATLPALPQGENADAAAAAKAARIRNRAQEIAQQQHCPWSRAWNLAQAEIG